MRCFSQVRFFCSYFSDCACGLLCIAEKDKNVKKYIFANCKSLFLCMGRTHICLSDDCNDFSQLDVWYICGRVSG